jgi:site-specific DNA-methyltransferase (adenine-specific)
MSRDWEIITGDCLEVMAILQPDSVRQAIADPPFNQSVDYGAGHDDNLPPEVYLAWCESWIHATVRLLTSDGSFWLLISHEWDWRLIPLAIKAGLTFRQRIIWYESFGVNCTRKFNRCTRPLLWFVRNPKRFVFDENCPSIRRPSDRQVKYKDRRANPQGKLLDDLWVIPRVAGTHRERIPGFPTQLPLKLLRRVVGCASAPGDLVLDPFAGSATSGVAAIEIGRRYVGIEKFERFARLARTRLESVMPLLV